MSDDIVSVKYGEFEIANVYDLPARSLAALVASGLAHKLGNEIAAKVAAYKAKATDGKLPSESEIAQFKAQKQKEMFASLLSGEAAASARGPRGSAIESMMKKIAAEELAARFRALGKSLPSGDKTITLTTGDGRVEAVTRATLIDRRVAAHSERLRAEAERRISEERAKAAAAVAAGGGTLSASVLLD